MDDPLSYRKGPLGHMLDMRKALGEVGEVTRQWCRAFDAGDDEAMEHLGCEFARVMTEVAKHSELATKASKG